MLSGGYIKSNIHQEYKIKILFITSSFIFIHTVFLSKLEKENHYNKNNEKREFFFFFCLLSMFDLIYILKAKLEFVQILYSFSFTLSSAFFPPPPPPIVAHIHLHQHIQTHLTNGSDNGWRRWHIWCHFFFLLLHNLSTVWMPHHFVFKFSCCYTFSFWS